jgi:hypothetical protein
MAGLDLQAVLAVPLTASPSQLAREELVERCVQQLHGWLNANHDADEEQTERECFWIAEREVSSDPETCIRLLDDKLPLALTAEMPIWAWDDPRWRENTPSAGGILRFQLMDHVLLSLRDTARGRGQQIDGFWDNCR